MHERVPQKHNYRPLLFLTWYGAINDSIGQNTDIEKILIMRVSAERASLENFPIFTF